MIINCRECRALCANAGLDVFTTDCAEFDGIEVHEIETDCIDSFPKKIVVKEADTRRELVYMPLQTVL